MEFYELFYKWVPLWVKVPVLTLLYLILLTANGVYTGNAADTASGLGVYTEPYTMAYYAMYIGMGIGSMTNIRIRERFTAKSLVLSGFVVMLLMNIVCATTSSPYLTIFACLLLGMGKVAASTEIYLVWLQVWSKKLDVSRLYPFVYFIALGGVYSMTWVTTKLSFLYNWRYAYVFIVAVVSLCLILAVVFIERHPLKRRGASLPDGLGRDGFTGHFDDADQLYPGLWQSRGLAGLHSYKTDRHQCPRGLIAVYPAGTFLQKAGVSPEPV